MISQAPPTQALLELDGFSWRAATAADAPAFEKLAALRDHRNLFSLPGSEANFAEAINQRGFRRAMVCTNGPPVIGVSAITMRNNGSLNVQLISLFEEPERAAFPLAVYIRHIFWSLPMHRIYVQLPVLGSTRRYVQLLKACGFVAEGVVRGFAFVAGQVRDVAAFGILRPEFDAWCLKNDPRLAL